MYLIDRPRLSCPPNSPHGWRKRAFPSLPSSATPSNPPILPSTPTSLRFFHLTHTPSLRIQLSTSLFVVSVSPPGSATSAVFVPCRILLELLVGRCDIPFLGWLGAMNRLNTCAPLGIPFLWLSGQRYAIEIRFAWSRLGITVGMSLIGLESPSSHAPLSR